MADVFISYSKQSRSLTEILARELESNGISTWWDASLVLGESFRTVILKELAVARAAIVIWSAASVRSDWVIAEVERAHARGILIPVRDPLLDVLEIPPPFGSLHTDTVTNIQSIYSALAKLGVHAKSKPSSDKPANRPNAKTTTPPVVRKITHLVSTPSIKAVLEGHEDRIESLVFSPDGSLALTTSAESVARLWNVNAGGVCLSDFERLTRPRPQFGADAR